MGKFFKILIAEDDIVLSKTYQTLLETRLNVEVSCFLDGEQAMTAVQTMKYDVYLLDINLPYVDGITIGKTIKSLYPTAYIIYLTGLGSPKDKAVSFNEGGADYFITKQAFHTDELLLKLNAVLNRLNLLDGLVQEVYTVVEWLKLDLQKNEIRCRDKVVALPQQEFDILLYMAKNRGKIVKREVLMKHIWGKVDEYANHNLNVHVSKLKKRLKECGGIEIFSETGQGYKLFIHDKE